MSDLLELKGLAVRCIIGDLPEERQQEREISLDLRITCDLTPACSHDTLEGGLDYARLVERIRDGLRTHKFRLIERAAEFTADICLAEPLVEQVWVRVEKTGCVAGLHSAAVEILRKR